MRRCYSCFKEFDDRLELCLYCGERYQSKPKEPIMLAPETLLEGRYIIGVSINSGGFGIVYKAWDKKLERIVAIKEFYPRKLVTRAEGTTEIIVTKKYQEEFEYRKQRFLSEARSMAKLGGHRSIPDVFEFFSANNTAYIVMEFLPGMSLAEYLGTVEEKLDPDFAVMIATEVGDALKTLHDNGIIHRDVAPDNIFICSDKKIGIKLIDLGAARLADDTDDVIDIVLKPGYSPDEQYVDNGDIGAWTDIYALGASLYKMLTGVRPEEATNRKIEDNVISPRALDNIISENLSNSVMKAMALDRHLRFQDVDSFLAAISGERKVVSLEEEKRQRRNRRIFGIIAACLVVLLAGALVFFQYSKKKAEVTLKSAKISMWIAVTEGSAEETATQTVIDDFTDKFPEVKITLKAIPEDEYVEAIRSAASTWSLPNVFESTNLPGDILESAADVTEILESEQAADCYFLNQYEEYYGGSHKQIPLGIEVPMAFVITNGYISTDYSSNYFSGIDSFTLKAEENKPAPTIALDGLRRAIVEENFPALSFSDEAYGDRRSFLSEGDNASPVLLSSSMSVEEIRESLLSYEKAYVFYEGNEIKSNFVYEWSMSEGTKNENAASVRLLEWMLGNVYQNTLMISVCNDGQIPINTTCFESKTGGQILTPLAELRGSIKMDGMIRQKNCSEEYMNFYQSERDLDNQFKEEIEQDKEEAEEAKEEG